MGLVVLLQALPMNPANGGTVAVRLAGGGGRPYVGYLGFDDWRAGLSGLPRFTTELGFDDSGWTGGALPQTAVIGFKGSDRTLASTLSGLFWKGARVIVSSGDDSFGPPSSWVTEMTGTIASVASSDGGLQITMSDLSGDLAKPIVPDTFAGTGGVEGADDATGRTKRRSWGRVWNVEGKLIDKANNLYEFGDPARPLQAIDLLKDKGRAGDSTVLAWQGSIAATFAALQVATCPNGGGVVAPSIAMAKWWTVPSGPLTADMRGETLNGYGETPTAIGSRIIAARSTVDPSFILNANRTYAAGIHADDASETVANVLDRLFLPCSLAWSLSPAGQITVGEWTWTGPVEVVASQQVERETVYSPLQTRKLGFQKNQREQNDSEISSTLLLATDATYADGTPIEVLKPAQPNADVTSNNTAAAIVAQGPGATAPGTAVLNSNVTIGADGKLTGAGGGQVSYGGIGGKQLGLLDSLFFGSPFLTETFGGLLASLNAFKTSLGTAGGIFGQGAFATLNSAGYGSNLLTGFGALSPLSSIAFGSNYLLEQGGGAVASLAAFKTVLGTSSGFTGQGALATLSSLANGSQYLSGFGALSSLARVQFGSAQLVNGAGVTATDAAYQTSLGTSAAFTGQGALATLARVQFGSAQIVTGAGASATDAAYQTGLGTAAAFSGQGAFATLSQVDLTNGSRFTFGGRFAEYNGDSRYFSAAQMIYAADGNLVSSLKPEEAGGNRTETRTAAAITGQGFGATAARSLVDNSYVPVGVNAQIDSGFTRTSATWFLVGPSSPGYRLEFNRSDYSGARSVAYLWYAGTPAAGEICDAVGLGKWTGFPTSDMMKYCVPVKAGDVIATRVLAAPHRCIAQLYLLVFNKDGLLIAAPNVSGGSPGGGGGGNNFGAPLEVVVALTDPASAYAQLMVRMAMDGQANPYLFFSEPWIGKLASANSQIPPYSPGPADPTSDQTGANTAAAFAGQGTLATKDNILLGSQGGRSYGLLTQNGFPTSDAGLVTAQGTAAALAGQGALATANLIRFGGPVPGYGGLVDETGSYYATDAGYQTGKGSAAGFFGQGGLATRNSVAYGDGYTFGFNYLATQTAVVFNTTTIRRADGSTSVTESLVVTEQGIAASFYGQGRGATSNSLADLDKAASDKLNAINGGGSQTAAYGVTINKVLTPGQVITLDAAVYREAGGNNGSIRCMIMGGPAGSAGQVAIGPSGPVGPSEPGGDQVTTTYTNQTGLKQNFAFYVTDTRTPTTAGGGIRASASYLIVT